MWVIVFLCLLVFAVIVAILIALGVGIGYLLHALIPGLGIDLAIVAGAVFAAALLDILARIFVAGMQIRREIGDEEPDAYADMDADAHADEPFVRIPPNWRRGHSSARKGKPKRR